MQVFIWLHLLDFLGGGTESCRMKVHTAVKWGQSDAHSNPLSETDGLPVAGI